MSLLIAMPGRDQAIVRDRLLALDASLDVSLWPELGQADLIEFAVLWNQPNDLLPQLPNLRVAQSYGAGVEHILNDSNLLQQTQVVRLGGPRLNTSMVDYLQKHIQAHEQKLPQDTVIGLLGFGELGQAVATHLMSMNYKVLAYASRQKKHAKVKTFYGVDLGAMIVQCDFLICLLPLTPATQNILNIRVLSQCKNDAWLINVGRGAQLAENDLIYALDEGLLRGATLDVTRQEPLPKDHPFFKRNDIELTHHTASLTDPVEAANVIYENYKSLQQGKTLTFGVDRELGY